MGSVELAGREEQTLSNFLDGLLIRSIAIAAAASSKVDSDSDISC